MRAVDALPWATILCVIFAVVGGAAVLTGDELSFKEYIESMTVAIGLLAVGRGIAAKRA